VVLFDWSDESNNMSSGWGEGAGDALFSLLAGVGLVDPDAGAANPPLHFIGHSFGTAVTSEVVERLARFDVPVDQVTYLDPHDFDQSCPVDGSQRLFDLGAPAGYGATVWNNVAFSDVYYQVRGLNGSAVPQFVVPLGRPIPGAANFWLDAENELPVATIFLPPSSTTHMTPGTLRATIVTSGMTTISRPFKAACDQTP